MLWIKNVAECNLWQKMCPGCLFIIPENVCRTQLSHIEKNSFVALPGKGGQQWIPALKNYSAPGGFGEEFYSGSLRVGLLTKIRMCVEPALLYPGLA